MENIEAIYGNQLKYAGDQYEALIEADALMILTEWSAFRTPSFKVIKELLKEPVIFDGRNLYDITRMQELGFAYDSIGRSKVLLPEKIYELGR